eukprot:gene18369-biopygen2407
MEPPLAWVCVDSPTSPLAPCRGAAMKLNIAYAESGTQKTFELDDEKVIQHIYDKRISQEFDGGVLGDNSLCCTRSAWFGARFVGSAQCSRRAIPRDSIALTGQGGG